MEEQEKIEELEKSMERISDVNAFLSLLGELVTNYAHNSLDSEMTLSLLESHFNHLGMLITKLSHEISAEY